MIKIAICDDSIDEIKCIVSLIEEYKVSKMSEISCETYENAVDLLEEMSKGKQYDIIFLDIVMPVLDGMAASKEIRTFNTTVKIVFFTTSPDFAVESYTVGAYYYILKPILKESFFSLLDRINSEFSKKNTEILIVKNKNMIKRIPVFQIEYCEVFGKNIFFHMINGEVNEKNGTFTEVFDSLKPYNYFVKPHRSYIINLNHILSISNNEIKMNSSATVPISRGSYNMVKDEYMNFFFDGAENND